MHTYTRAVERLIHGTVMDHDLDEELNRLFDLALAKDGDDAGTTHLVHDGTQYCGGRFVPQEKSPSGGGSLTLAIDGHAITIDKQDEERVRCHEWYVDHHGYAATETGLGRVRMHQFILTAEPRTLIDHINGNRLDNRRSNLRYSTPTQNQQNRGKPRTTAAIASRYKGVSWDKSNHRWRAKIVVHGRQHHLGYFDDEVDAAHAYDAAAARHFAEFARPNFRFPLALRRGKEL